MVSIVHWTFVAALIPALIPATPSAQRPADSTSARGEAAPVAPAVGQAAAAIPGDSIFGRVFDVDGKPRMGVAVSLNAVDKSGTLQWRDLSVTDENGDYSLRVPGSGATTPSRFQLDVDRQRLAVDTGSRWLLSPTYHKWIERVRIEWEAEAGALTTRRLDLRLRYDPAPPFYTLLLMGPALVGLLAASLMAGGLVVMARSAAGSGANSDATPSRSSREKDSRLMTLPVAQQAAESYVMFGSITWVIVMAWFAIGFVRSDLQAINLFSPGMRVPVVIPVAAFLGVLVFATGRLIELAKESNNEEQREAIHLDLGNRVFIAPYVAIVAVLILFDERDGSKPVMVAFATGLWIEPVLETVRQLGLKLIPSAAERVVVADATASTAAGAAARAATATPSLVDAPVAEAPIPVITNASWETKDGTTTLRVLGSGFRKESAMTVDGKPVAVAAFTPRELTATTNAPAAPSTTLAVTVTTPPPGGGTVAAVASAGAAANA